MLPIPPQSDLALLTDDQTVGTGDVMKRNNLSETAKRSWKRIVVAVASAIGITAAIISVGVSIGVIHIGDVNIHTSVSQVVNMESETETNQGGTDNVQHATFQLEDLEPCTTYEFQASLDPDFKDAETITFTTKCEE